MRKFLALIFCFIIFPQNSLLAAQLQSQFCEKETIELQIYREGYEEIENALKLCQKDKVAYSPDLDSLDIAYAKRYYEQEANLREIEIAIYQWQIDAANVILALVIALTLAGVGFSGYQLWHSARLSKLPQNLVDMELSFTKLKLQTSMIGVVTLIVSYAFLLLFTHEIYQMRTIDRKPISNDHQKNIDLQLQKKIPKNELPSVQK